MQPLTSTGISPLGSPSSTGRPLKIGAKYVKQNLGQKKSLQNSATCQDPRFQKGVSDPGSPGTPHRKDPKEQQGHDCEPAGQQGTGSELKVLERQGGWAPRAGGAGETSHTQA